MLGSVQTGNRRNVLVTLAVITMTISAVNGQIPATAINMNMTANISLLVSISKAPCIIKKDR